MADRRASRSFNDFCQGYLLGLNENHANCQQDTGMGAEQGFPAPNAFPMDCPEDALGGGLFCADDALGAGASYEQFGDAQAGNFLFEQPANAQLPLTLVDPLYRHPADGQGGPGIPANMHAPVLADPFRHYADVAHPDPSVRTQSRPNDC
ncbi:hypothetical protein INS49_004595 [Diaporthe citri]|uniref:uncharacterized protein n=1 Tax=Diaporthe citri TaxID=83186 RepID=UPI001C7F5190|nr:uncharacterized protein INS49_004595 [Diaporthe citri]KAG6354577.1 hypothetical protein INS49_004595 [Diaporthe citri]